ncbi:hypothetical protein [Nonomuraea sp. NPDC046570]|uniref:hypothetical protein n=1 Tax=Nonomuraea sp. NPDC046570 TaxID=3155255 RepID=UPI0033DCBD2F
MRRLLASLLALSLASVLVSCSADPAEEAARFRADEIARQLGRGLSWNPEDIGHWLSREKDVTVYSVTGTRYSLDSGEMGRVVLRIRATATAGSGVRGIPRDKAHLATPVPPLVAAPCFEISVSYADAEVDEVGCPDGPPPVFRAPAEIPDRAHQWLKSRLPKAPDLQSARDAVRSLDLDDRIRVEVADINGVIGVALYERPGVCLFARVRSVGVEVWSPSRIQVMPGEGSCSAAEAASGFAQRPPH